MSKDALLRALVVEDEWVARNYLVELLEGTRLAEVVGAVSSLEEAAAARGIEWIHVDYEPHLDGFYRACGFQPTLAGLISVPAPA